MDDQAAKFSIENPFYKNQILQDLPVAVLKDGQWGSYRNLENQSRQTLSDEFQAPDVHLSDFR